MPLQDRPVAAPPVDRYREARSQIERGEYARARSLLSALDSEETAPGLRALVRNDLAALDAVAGDRTAAEAGFRAALALDPECGSARANLAALEPPAPRGPNGARRVAVLSLLFNWPSTGGGNVHTAELTKFLAAAGYAVRHLYARFEPWGLGRVTEPTPHPADPVEFRDADWTAERIVARFRAAVDAFDPDWVVLTDSWNMKPLMAAAAGGRPYVLRLQALECLCPLNNVRLLPAAGGPRQCARHQLATPDACARCVRELERTSGELHRAERELAGVGTPHYRQALVAAFAEAAAVLVVDPLAAAMVGPHAGDVRVVTAGMDPARFPWPFPADRKRPPTPGRLRVLFAGLTHEWTKGFQVLRAAADLLWAVRQDFEVVATGDPPEGGAAEPWARYVGWQSQADLPEHMAGADIVAVPAVAQEALGRSAVEAMGAGRAVVASRIGGLPFTVLDGATGLLCEPGDPRDLAAKLAALLDDGALRCRLGSAGRRRFEEHYAWPVVVARHYVPLFGAPRVAGTDPRPADRTAGPSSLCPSPRSRWRVVVATRSTSDERYHLSGEFLTFTGEEPSHRVRVTGADPAEYFRQLAAVDADWVISIAEDAFLLDPDGLLALIERMEEEEYAACGVPDGGAVPVRAHNPAACNALFNVFDLRRCRPAWADWDRVLRLRHRPEYERQVPPPVPGVGFAFDDSEPYYGAFFALREAGEKILPLAAETWRDGVTTLVRGPKAPLLLHAWYSDDPAGRRRYTAVAAHARAHRTTESGQLSGAQSP